MMHGAYNVKLTNYYNSINYTYMYLTYFGLYLGHPHACQFKNHGMCIDMPEEGLSTGRNM